jgi:hypothetical protein
MNKEEDFGTNIDGSRSKEYCCHCFQKGKFTDEGISLQEKINKLQQELDQRISTPTTVNTKQDRVLLSPTGFTFDTPANLGPPVNTSYHEGFLCISSDGLELYFGSPQPIGGYGNSGWCWRRNRQCRFGEGLF